jgi:hypothetical protein
MKSVDVTLTYGEVLQAGIIGVLREVENIFSGRQHKHGMPPEEGWRRHIEGTIGEIAFAKWTGKFWSGNIRNYKAADVGPFQVRAVARHDRCLLVHDDDKDGDVFVLVTGLAPTVRIRGWMWGHEAKQEQHLADPVGGRPAYFVQPKYLRPMSEPPHHAAAPEAGVA